MHLRTSLTTEYESRVQKWESPPKIKATDRVVFIFG